MLTINELVAYLDELLTPDLYRDYCPNGLQVSGNTYVTKLVTGVSANQTLLDQAAKVAADAVLVHHGFFWQGEDPTLVGIKRARMWTLLKNDLNLLSYHLPLDGHAIFGNNIQLAKVLGIHAFSEIKVKSGPGILHVGNLAQSMSGNEFALHIEHQLLRKPFYIQGHSSEINRIAWCTGAAQDYIEKAAKSGVDAFLTGEVSERTVSLARELGIHFYAAGHHATERYGVLALGEHLTQKFGIVHEFIDVDNPI
jgi:dinuclear metal center YbgI/SA1388 family protein